MQGSTALPMARRFAGAQRVCFHVRRTERKPYQRRPKIFIEVLKVDPPPPFYSGCGFGSRVEWSTTGSRGAAPKVHVERQVGPAAFKRVFPEAKPRYRHRQNSVLPIDYAAEDGGRELLLNR